LSQTTADTILSTMEQVAEKGGDVTPQIFERYFDRCRESRALMDHMDEHMLGRMMDQVFLLLMEPGEEELHSYLEFETSTHRSYGVQPHMYENLMAALLEIIREVLGEDLTEEAEAALNQRTRFLLTEIVAASD
jgi:hemoglobin-like flavoprotein